MSYQVWFVTDNSEDWFVRLHQQLEAIPGVEVRRVPPGVEFEAACTLAEVTGVYPDCIVTNGLTDYTRPSTWARAKSIDLYLIDSSTTDKRLVDAVTNFRNRKLVS